MTLEEQMIVSAYTGYLMCDVSNVHKYIAKKLGHPVWTHEMATENFWETLREKVKPDFIRLCGPSSNHVSASKKFQCPIGKNFGDEK